MILEQLIFTVLAFGIFVYMFFKMFKENDTNYIGILMIEAIGISLNFVEVLKKVEFGPFWTIIKYILAILIPIAIMILDKKLEKDLGKDIVEVLNLKEDIIEF